MHVRKQASKHPRTCSFLQAPIRYCTQIGAMSYFTKEKLFRNVYTNVYCSIIPNIQQVENNPNTYWQING